MPTRLAVLALSAFACLAPAPSQAAPPRADVLRNRSLASSCPRGLKFAAGACVRRCPPGYRSTGRICRVDNQLH